VGEGPAFWFGANASFAGPLLLATGSTLNLGGPYLSLSGDGPSVSIGEPRFTL